MTTNSAGRVRASPCASRGSGRAGTGGRGGGTNTLGRFSFNAFRCALVRPFILGSSGFGVFCLIGLPSAPFFAFCFFLVFEVADDLLGFGIFGNDTTLAAGSPVECNIGSGAGKNALIPRNKPGKVNDSNDDWKRREDIWLTCCMNTLNTCQSVRYFTQRFDHRRG
jgi:hypothetical protein